MIRMTKKRAIGQLKNLRGHCCEMSEKFGGQVWKNDIAALDVAIEFFKNDRNEMIIENIKRIIEKYDEMNLIVSFEERKENHIKAYMEIKDYFNTAEDKKMKYVIKGKDRNTKEVVNYAEFRNEESAQYCFTKLVEFFGQKYDFWVEIQPGVTKIIK